MTFDIEKRAREVMHSAKLLPESVYVERAIELAREAADARAEEIADRLESGYIFEMSRGGFSTRECPPCAAAARSFISKPEPREQRLEKALRQIAGGYNKPHQQIHLDDIGCCCGLCIARRALEET